MIYPSKEFQYELFEVGRGVNGPGVESDDLDYFVVKEVDSPRVLSFIIAPAGVHTAASMFKKIIPEHGYVEDMVTVRKLEVKEQF